MRLWCFDGKQRADRDSPMWKEVMRYCLSFAKISIRNSCGCDRASEGRGPALQDPSTGGFQVKDHLV